MIACSGGTSSILLVALVIKGWIERPKHLLVLFADTGWEHSWTYEAIDKLERLCVEHGIDFMRVANGNLRKDLLQISTAKRIEHPPFWVDQASGRGRVHQRCTKHYKIVPMRRACRAWLKQHSLPMRVVKWLGFGSDEVHRANKAIQKQPVKWETLDFPLIRMGINRSSQRVLLTELLGWAPRFSSCIGCPGKSAARWHATPSNAGWGT